MYTLDEIRSFRIQYGRKKLILDTNLLVLVMIASLGIDRISESQLTKKYNSKDMDILKEIFKYFDSEIVITPHVLTELSNLSEKVPSHQTQYYFNMMTNRLRSFKEENAAMEDLLGVRLEILSRLGFTDVSLIDVSKRIDGVILTDDMALSVHATKLGIPSINFTNITTSNFYP